MAETRKQKMERHAALALDLARKAGASQAAVEVSHSRFAQAGFRDGEMDRSSASARQGLSLSLFIEGRYGVHGTSDLRAEALTEFVTDAAEMTKLLEPDSLRSLPPQSLMAKPPGPDLMLFDQAVADAPAAFWVERAALMDELCKEAAAKSEYELVGTQSGAYGEKASELMANSEGFAGFLDETVCYNSANLVFMDPGNAGARQMGFWGEIDRTLSGIGERGRMAGVAQLALERAQRQMNATPGPSGKYAVAVENIAATKLVQDLLACMAGSAVEQKRSWLSESLGQVIGSPLLTLVDEPLTPGGLGSRWFDNEGMAVGRRVLVNRGVLDEFLLNTYYGKRLKMEPNSGSTSNIIVEPTHGHGFDDLLAVMGEGLAVTSFLGGNFNSTTGDFSFGVRGLWVEDGKVSHAVKDMNMSGNYRELWSALAAVGGDPYPNSRIGAPSMVFSLVQLAGA